MKFYGHKKLDKFLYENYFKDIKGGICLECGAYDGINLSSTYILEKYNGWTCINVEAQKANYDKLVINRPHSTNLHYGLSDINGTQILEYRNHFKNCHLTGNTGISDYLQKPRVKGEGFKGGTIKETVNTITYKSLIEYLSSNVMLLNRLDLFVLDVEGWEYNVIKGMKDSKVLPDVFCIEACPSSDKIIHYDNFIENEFEGLYKLDNKCWLNNIYVKVK